MSIRSMLFIVGVMLTQVTASTTLAGAGSDTWVLRNVNVLAMDGQPLRRAQDVLIEGHRVAAISPAGELDAPTIVDGRDGYLIPGLSDMHVHLGSELMLAMWLQHGVTHLRVMNSQPHVVALRDQIDLNQVIGPRIFLASPLMEGDTPLWPGSEAITEPDDARRLVRDYAAQGHRAIKIYDGLSLEVLAAIVEEAARAGLPVVGHMPDSVPLQTLLGLGISSLEHTGGLLPKWFTDGRDACDIPSGQLQQLGRDLAHGGITLVPTLSLYQMLADSAAQAQARAEGVFALLPAGLTEHFWATATPTVDSERARTSRCRFDNARTLVAAHIAAGGHPLAGTDTPNPWLIPGVSLHRELVLLVQAGLSPEQALAGATRLPAQWSGEDALRGTITPGKAADLVLLEANPLEDITNTRRIVGVAINGVWHTAAELDEVTRAIAAQPDQAP